MTICRVVGTVVASERADEIDGATFFLVRETDTTGTADGSAAGATLIALDAVQAGEGDLVLVAQGSSCRQIMDTRDKAVDALIVGIIDLVDEGGTLRYRSAS
jgi:ethanolamine utilization protein EutN